MEHNFDEWSEDGDVSKEAPKNVPSAVRKYRPQFRPPMGVLMIFDDGLDTYETRRIRADETTIGRNADVSIPHDYFISDVHLMLRRENASGKYAWVLEEVSKETPLFVRAKKFELRDGTEFLAGSNRFSYAVELESTAGTSELRGRLEAGSVPGASIFEDGIRYPCLRSTTNSQKLWLIAGEYWIGRSSDCAICMPDDEFLTSKHVKISHEDGKWLLSTAGVTNGFWVRISTVRIRTSCTFQIGEQRFRFVAL